MLTIISSIVLSFGFAEGVIGSFRGSNSMIFPGVTTTLDLTGVS